MALRVATLPSLLALGLAVVVASPAIAQPDAPLVFSSDVGAAAGLGEIVEETSHFQQAVARTDAIRTAVRQARAAGLPQITLQASAAASGGDFDLGPTGEGLLRSFLGESADGPLAFGEFGSANTRQAQLAVTQPVFTGFRIRNGIRQAKAVVAAAEADLEATRQQLMVEIADAALSLRAAEGRRESSATSVELLTRQVRAATATFEAGQATRTDIALAEAQLAAARARYAASVAQVTAARGRVQALTGRDRIDLALTAPGSALSSDVENAVAQALLQHPAVLASAALVAADDAAAQAAMGARAPTVQLRGAVGVSENRFLPGDEGTNSSITAEMSVPVFSGGAVSANIAEAKATARARRFSDVDIRRQIETGVRTAFAANEAARLQLAAAQARLEAIELAYRGVVLEREVGQRSVLDVLRVEDDLQSARTDLLDAEREAVLAALRLAQATGALGR